MRLIDADVVEKVMNERYTTLASEYGHYDHYTTGYGDALCVVEDAPTIDAVPVVHGRWEEADDGDGAVCSVCGEDFCNVYLEVERFNYCPHCGAKMDGERKDNA